MTSTIAMLSVISPQVRESLRKSFLALTQADQTYVSQLYPAGSLSLGMRLACDLFVPDTVEGKNNLR